MDSTYCQDKGQKIPPISIISFLHSNLHSMEDQSLLNRLGMERWIKGWSGIIDSWSKRCILVDSEIKKKIPLFHNAFVSVSKNWTYSGERFSSIKRMISSVNHGFEIKMITISPWWEKEKGIGGSFHHKAIMLSQNVTIYHGWKMTLTVSQGKLLLKCSHLDQYTMFFFPPLAKSNYTTETSQSIPSQANLNSAI